MRTWLALCAVLVACGPSSRGDDHPPTPTLRIQPPDFEATIVDGAAVTQPYTATLLTPDNDPVDVTDGAAFSLMDPELGNWSGADLTVSGTGAGPTRVVAIASDLHGGNLQGDTGLTVFIKGSRVDGTGVPGNAGDLFDAATETPALAPALRYPADNITVPPNLGALDVHWADTTANDLFETAVRTQYVDLRIFKARGPTLTTAFTPAEWSIVASTHESVAVTVAALATANPGHKGTTPAQHVAVTNEYIVGGMYYWSTTPVQGVLRYDMSTPNIAPALYFPPGTQPPDCFGCHALSRDGSRMALTTIPHGDGIGAVYDVGTHTVLFPTPQPWNFATFSPDNARVVTVSDGVLAVRSATTGAVLANIPTTAGFKATHPELSPDGTALANVETTTGTYDYQVSDGTIVTRTFDNATNQVGPIKVLVANATGASNYYPSYSPDGQWILFTRTDGNSYSNPTAEVWVVKADGTQPPIRLASALGGPGMMDSWARWAPFAQTLGPTNEPLFFITFSSMRPFGVLPLTPDMKFSSLDMQIWMAPFFPNAAAAGHDPSGPAFRMPFQDFTSSNHIAQWTQQVVIGRKLDGTPAIQADLTR